ncbi:winged helix-turn-helix domain-containing protein [Roseomonas alba]|uniref:winged helix-turn-helix domain-containing protein n=1 Tax=Roseomonas alba TaxID=2846776 RepID=UPI001CA553C5|nr:winged helix-turn-helix domain-containing protein [Neoroseomonas alba]
MKIAEDVLKDTGRPMSAREILDFAYEFYRVPNHLYGKTQHRTLQARISVDIIERGAKSRFLRVGPGMFFLRPLSEGLFSSSAKIKEYFARRRIRDYSFIEIFFCDDVDNYMEDGRILLRSESISIFDRIFSNDVQFDRYKDILKRERSSIFAVLTIIQAGDMTLVHKIGKFDGRKIGLFGFSSIGFQFLLGYDDFDLFHDRLESVENCAVRGAWLELGLPRTRLSKDVVGHDARLLGLFWSRRRSIEPSAIVAVVRYRIRPEDNAFRRALSFAGMRWMTRQGVALAAPRFDPWSKAIWSNRALVRDLGFGRGNQRLDEV